MEMPEWRKRSFVLGLLLCFILSTALGVYSLYNFFLFYANGESAVMEVLPGKSANITITADSKNETQNMKLVKFTRLNGDIDKGSVVTNLEVGTKANVIYLKNNPSRYIENWNEIYIELLWIAASIISGYLWLKGREALASEL